MHIGRLRIKLPVVAVRGSILLFPLMVYPAQATPAIDINTKPNNDGLDRLGSIK